MKEKAEPVTLEREYGDYHVKICFAPQDVPEAEEKLLDALMEAFKQRVSNE